MDSRASLVRTSRSGVRTPRRRRGLGGPWDRGVPPRVHPHYDEYYGGEGPLHESMRPKPVEFLTVRRGSRWRTVLVSERRGSLDVALRLLKYGVERLGIGARTCAGYGYGEAMTVDRGRSGE
ncbi:type III-B CRISPR module RAMP protein Cmr6 [Methanopyrus kandleri]